MAYRQSLMKYAEKYGVSRASRKYNKSRSYIYFWKQRWDGTVASLACQSRRPHRHPNQHTAAELKLIRDMRRRNPELGMIELWHRLRQRGYTRRPESLFRVMRKMGLFPAEKPKKQHKPKPYTQMTRPGERVQVDVKVVPRRCIADSDLRLFQYTAIDEFTRLRFLAAYPEQSTYSSADFLRRLTNGTHAAELRWSAYRQTTVLNSPIVSPPAGGMCLHCSRKLLLNLEFSTNLFGLILRDTMARLNAATVRTRNASILPIPSILLMTFPSSLLSTTAVPTTYL